jgi:hypothetical protein
MTYSSTDLPPHARRARTRRARPARRRRRLLISRRRAIGRIRVPYAADALNAVMQEGDIYKIGQRHYLVAPICAELLETLIVAAGAGEDDEPDNDDLGVDDDGEPSLGQTGADLESDGLDDEALNGRGEAALGWVNEGNQLNLGVPQADEAEPSLGWANEVPQFRLAAGYSWGDAGESDGDCDAEPDNDDLGIDDLPHDEIGVVE